MQRSFHSQIDVLGCITRKLDYYLELVLEYFKCKWIPVIVQNVLDINGSFFNSPSVRKTIFIQHAILVVEKNHIEAIIAFVKACYLKNIN